MLHEQEPSVIDAVFDHPLQRDTVRVIAKLITMLRQLSSQSDYYEFQRLLLGYIQGGEQLQGLVKKNATAARRGKPTPTPISGDWGVETLVVGRTLRQLKTVGDALAWRCFGYKSLFIMALSRDSGGGPMFGKEGLRYEIAEVMRIWKEERHFALLNGVTNCIRAADVTEFAEEGAILYEVKKNPERQDRRQWRRLEAIQEAVNEGVPLKTPSGLLRFRQSQVQLRSRIKTDLARAAAMACAHGTAEMSLGDSWGLRCYLHAGFQDQQSPGRDGPTSAAPGPHRRTLKAQDEPRLSGVSLDRAGRAIWGAPFTIYPLDPLMCALLTCDYMWFETEIALRRLATAFGEQGLEIEFVLDSYDRPLTDSDIVCRIRRNGRVIDVYLNVFVEILMELVEPRLYACAMRDAIDLPGDDGDSAGTFAFANERAVWR